MLKNFTVFEVYDSNDQYKGFYLANEEQLAKQYSENINGYYTEATRTMGC